MGTHAGAAASWPYADVQPPASAGGWMGSESWRPFLGGHDLFFHPHGKGSPVLPMTAARSLHFYVKLPYLFKIGSNIY